MNPDDNESTTFGEVVADDNVASAAVIMEAKEKLDEKCREIRQFVASVKALGYSERDQTFFFRRYGLEGYPQAATLEEIGESQTPPITRERVRQIIFCIWEDLEDHKIEFDDVSLPATLEIIDRFESLTGVKADIICKKTDESWLLDDVVVLPRVAARQNYEPQQPSTLVVTRIVKPQAEPEPAAGEASRPTNNAFLIDEARRKVTQLASAIKKLELSLREEDLFNTHYGLNGKARVTDIETLASRNLLLVNRVNEMLAGVWAKIATSKRVEFIKDEVSLLAALDLIARPEAT